MDGLLAALQFLTRLPLPAGVYSLENGVVWLPVAGFILGGILALTDVALRWLQAPAMLESTILVALLIGLSGALHVDGLMDTCDAVFTHASPERRLEIMRDPRAGAFGVAGLVCVVALKISALASLPEVVRTQLLLLAPTLGRWAIVLVAMGFPYGRASGLGAPLKAAATPRAFALASVLPLVLSVVLGPAGMLGGALAALTALAAAWWLMRLLPGLTGDCYGAVCEVVETSVWLGSALAAPRLGL